MIEIRLDQDIEVGAKARPRYSTDLVQTDGGHEVATERWRYPLFTFEFNLEPGVPNFTEDLEEFIDVFHLAGGRAGRFLFRHWRDYQAVDQLIGEGDGSKTAFQLYRVYVRGALTRRRKITRPVSGTVTVKVNGVVTAATLGALGVVTFAAPPANGADITATFDFDIPVRFESDEIEFVALNDDLEQAVDIVLVEVRE